MSAIQISRAVRLAVEARFAELFNDAVWSAALEFGVDELMIPTINFAEYPDVPQNFYRGVWTLDDMQTRQTPDWPAMCMWVGEGQDQKTQKPRVFSGVVAVYWRFWLVVEGLKRAGLIDLREAVESAMVWTLHPEGLGYRGDLSWGQLVEQSILGQDEQHYGWLQEVTYTASFEVDT
jgi:hypothetical protein